MYSMQAGGKRFRPALLYEASIACGLEIQKADTLAVAMECLHTYSLIHDDLPAMDNDDFRRGKLSNHKKFNEATAILAGDALQSLAFEILLSLPNSGFIGRYFARTTGCGGMISGQYLDMFHATQVNISEKISRLKTGKLIQACIVLPYLYTGQPKSLLMPAARWALRMGKLFQLTDDILDVTGVSSQLGKTAGKDKAQKKQNLINMSGLETAQKKAGELAKFLQVESHIFKNTTFFKDLPHYLLNRLH